MHAFSTVIPIFSVVILGWISRRSGFMPSEFLGPANRLVYFLAIPALIFRAVSKASFRSEFDTTVLIVTLASAIGAYLGAWLVSRCTHWKPSRIGAFIQCAGHGNHAYVGLPIAYYFIGEVGLAKTSILAGFLFILQNILSVLVLQAYAVPQTNTLSRVRIILDRLIRNPVIISALLGMVVSLLQVSIPTPILRFLDIMSGLAPPLSLLLIGASLSVEVMKKNLFSVMGSVAIKIIALPLVGLILFRISGVDASLYLPGLILLATPTATVAFVMSEEMGGDGEFAAAAVSATTICSAATYLFWLTIVDFI